MKVNWNLAITIAVGLAIFSAAIAVLAGIRRNQADV